MRREAGSLLVLLLGRTFFGICLVQCSEEAAAGQLFAETLWQRFAEKKTWRELFSSLAQQLPLDMQFGTLQNGHPCSVEKPETTVLLTL